MRTRLEQHIECLAACLLLAALLCSCAAPVASPVDRPAGFLAAVLEIYRGPLNHLYAIRGGQCPMYPTCSEYSRQAIARHGPVIGWMMTTDRLLRCGRDETHLAPRVMIDGQLKTYDPVEENDFWWFTGQSRRRLRQPASPPAGDSGRDKVIDLSGLSN